MKSLNLIIFLISILLSNKVFPQTEKYKGEKIENKIEFEGNINEVWTYLSNLGNLENLVPSTIEKSVLVGNGKGSIVTITLKNNRGTVIEKVIKIDNEKRIISYTMIETPMPIKSYVASFEVNKSSNSRVTVVFKASFKVQEKNKEQRVKAFNDLQLELLTSIKNLSSK